jgi:hypothetical protein
MTTRKGVRTIALRSGQNKDGGAAKLTIGLWVCPASPRPSAERGSHGHDDAHREWEGDGRTMGAEHCGTRTKRAKPVFSRVSS